jgi:hypothetical protein
LSGFDGIQGGVRHDFGGNLGLGHRGSHIYVS